MEAIHVIRKLDPTLPGIVQVEGSEDTFTSGYWYLPLTKAQQLIGRRIYFHRAQAKPSFYGGLILDATEVAEGQYNP